MTERFLDRRARREASAALTGHIVFGLVLSLLLIGLGGWKYWFSVGAWDGLWRAVLVFGGGGLLLTLILPTAWEPLESLLQRAGGAVGHALFAAFLALVYWLFFWPVGAWLRRHGDNPIRRWQGAAAPVGGGWRDKTVADALTGEGARFGLWRVLGFFVRRGQWLLLPALLLLVSLGLVFFFVQSSALAPFIYVLF